MSLWAEYSKEMCGVETIESAIGFLTYRINGKIIHVVDFYVSPEARQGAASREMIDEVQSIGRKAGCEVITGEVDARLTGATRRLAFWIRQGAEVLKAHDGVIVMVKRL